MLAGVELNKEEMIYFLSFHLADLVHLLLRGVFILLQLIHQRRGKGGSELIGRGENWWKSKRV